MVKSEVNSSFLIKIILTPLLVIEESIKESGRSCVHVCVLRVSIFPLFLRGVDWVLKEDTKGVTRIRKSKDRQHNGQKKKDKRTNNDLQNMTHKTKS